MHLFRLLALVVFALCFLPNSLEAQVSITLDPVTASVADAAEFFTDVYAEPRDYDTTCDAGSENYMLDPRRVENGIFVANNPGSSGPKLDVVPIPIPNTPDAYRENCHRLGVHVPIDADTYTHLSYRIKNSAIGSATAVLWSFDHNFSVSGIEVYDGFELPDEFHPVQNPANIWKIDKFDIPSLASNSHRWQGNITGLTLFPNLLLPIGSTIMLDWYRLIDPTTSAQMNFNWSTTGAGVDTRDRVRIFVDNDNTGYDGTPVEQGLALTGTYSFLTGTLPAGTYYFYADVVNNNSNTPDTVAQSNYVGPLVINGKPVLRFTSPSRTSGTEFARDERRDPWDMNQSTDLSNLVLPDGSETPAADRGFHDYSFENGLFRATSDFDPAGPAVTVDTRIQLTVPLNTLVNTNVYRYFCVKTQFDSNILPRNENAQELNDAGWVARFAYLRNGVQTQFGITKGIQVIDRTSVYPDLDNGFVTYCLDLWDDAVRDSGPQWKDSEFVDVVRFDPVEAQKETNFAIDHIGLYAENSTFLNGEYELRWTASDPENDKVDVALYYDSDNSGFNGTLITSFTNIDADDGRYVWDASGVAEGQYYIYAVIDDGTNSPNRFYADVPIHVRLQSAACDNSDVDENNNNVPDCQEVSVNTDVNGLCVKGASDCIHENLLSTACVGVNGFLEQINIASVINLLTQNLGVRVQYFNLAGVLQGEVNTTVGAGLKADFIINDMGLQANSVGTVCVKTDGPTGSWTGGVAIYKPDTRNGSSPFGEAFDFALYYPFLNPFTAPVTVPLNTFHLGLPAENLVSNWIAIIDALQDGEPLKGTLRYYNSAGEVLSEEAVQITDGGRSDFAGHLGVSGASNVDAIGLARFIPDTLQNGDPAKYYLTLTRYFYDCAGASCNNFLTAFNLPYRPGTNSTIIGGVSTVNGEISVIELNNITSDDVSAGIDVYNSSGSNMGTPSVFVPALGTRHVVVNRSGDSGFLTEEQAGSAVVKAQGSGFISALSIFYKLNSFGGLEYAYASPFVDSPGTAQTSQFNSFIQHQSTTEVYNIADSSVDVDLSFIDVAGSTVFQNNFSLPAKATQRLDSISLPANTFGTVKLQANGSGIVLRNYISRDGIYTLSFPGE